MKYLEHGDLEGYLTDPMPENEGRTVTQQACNILILHKGPEWWIKIADFGISKRVENTALRTRIGTDAYLAPETKGKNFTFAIDIWAVGAIVFRMVSCRLPFLDDPALSDYVEGALPFPVVNGISQECSEFMVQTMKASPLKRPTSHRAMSHPWLRVADQVTTSVPVPAGKTGGLPLPELRTYKPSSQFQAYNLPTLNAERASTAPDIQAPEVLIPNIPVSSSASNHTHNNGTARKSIERTWPSLELRRKQTLKSNEYDDTVNRYPGAVTSLHFSIRGHRILSRTKNVFALWESGENEEFWCRGQQHIQARGVVRSIHVSQRGDKFTLRRQRPGEGKCDISERHL
ncbi:kinase-like protein [Mollisia scopiformis]|uniref:Kinase-like protein n=1 Tax=Mollisia scopiformis TaxID=149040 RepID=A0A194XMF4_MOLSC|nr:kinase-like protein [Mollisia scopiformis]KUJ21306.1 kinase-like protein [Mollisia scopiformis]